MKINIIEYDQTETICDAVGFEFRTNYVSNWVRVKVKNSDPIIVRDVCVIKTLEDSED